jgi:hypothetical protein
MKTSTTVDAHDFQHLSWFRDEGPGKSRTMIGIVVYMGERVLTFDSKLFALPLSMFWSLPP